MMHSDVQKVLGSNLTFCWFLSAWFSLTPINKCVVYRNL